MHPSPWIWLQGRFIFILPRVPSSVCRSCDSNALLTRLKALHFAFITLPRTCFPFILQEVGTSWGPCIREVPSPSPSHPLSIPSSPPSPQNPPTHIVAWTPTSCMAPFRPTCGTYLSSRTCELRPVGDHECARTHVNACSRTCLHKITACKHFRTSLHCLVASFSLHYGGDGLQGGWPSCHSDIRPFLITTGADIVLLVGHELVR